MMPVNKPSVTPVTSQNVLSSILKRSQPIFFVKHQQKSIGFGQYDMATM